MKRLLAASIIVAAVAGAARANAAQTGNSAVPLRSTAPTASTAIRLDQVTIQAASGWQNNFAYSGILSVKFTNMDEQPAVAVIYAVRNDDGTVVTVKDVGDFPKGQTVSHQFYGLDVASDATVEIEQAVFADGSSWTNSLRRRQTANN